MEQTRTFGYVPSVIDGTELIYNGDDSLDIPEEYSYVDFMPHAYNQGQYPICVTESVRAYIDWNINVDESKDNKEEHQVAVFDIYASKTNEGDGMTFKDALYYLRHHGVNTNVGNETIERYAMVNGIDSLKRALINNGPCVGAFLVRDPQCGTSFWKGNGFLGGHAISIVGYDKEGFIIRNSWGTEWGNNGYTKLPYNEFHYLMECWTIIA